MTSLHKWRTITNYGWRLVLATKLLPSILIKIIKKNTEDDDDDRRVVVNAGQPPSRLRKSIQYFEVAATGHIIWCPAFFANSTWFNHKHTQKQTTRGSLPCYYKEFDAQKFDSNFEKSISSGLSGFLVLIGILIVPRWEFWSVTMSHLKRFGTC